MYLLFGGIGRETTADRVHVNNGNLCITLQIAAGVEAAPAMVSAIATEPNSSERQLGIDNMHSNFIDNKRTRTCFRTKPTFSFTVFAEAVNGEWFWFFVELIDELIEIFITDDRQNWTENLLSHEAGFAARLFNDSWLNKLFILEYFSTGDYLASMAFFEISRQPLDMSFVDDFSHI